MNTININVKIDWFQKFFILGMIAVLFFGAGVFYSMNSHAADRSSKIKRSSVSKKSVKRSSVSAPDKSRVVYPTKSEVDFEGMSIQGEVRNPGEFYFQRRQEEKFDSLVKRRKNFQREMLRDVVMTK